MARDTRASGEMLKMAAASALISTGCEVIDIGIAPTPTVGLAVTNLKAKGGITITASHNPIEWNALKFFDQMGRYLSSEEIDKIKSFIENKGFACQEWRKLGKIRTDNSQIKKHFKKILSLKYIKTQKIKKARFKVVIDAVNGAGYSAGPELLQALGCRIVKINCDFTGTFPRKPEPLPENLVQLKRVVKKHKADIGFALDPDADRLAIVSEQGKAIGEEYTLALAVDYVLSQKPGPVAVNLSTSRMIEEVARKNGCPLERTKVGEASVSLKLEQIRGVIGGEGNGGVILPELHYTRDAMLGMALILSYMAKTRQTLTNLVTKIPKYYMIKRVAEIGADFESELELLKQQFGNAEVDTLDGVKFDFQKSWLHIRKSNTEPVVRIIAEARSRSEADALIQKTLQILKEGQVKTVCAE